MGHTIEHSRQRFPLVNRVRQSVDNALLRAVVVEIGAAHALLEWVNSVDEGLDEIQALRHRKSPERASEDSGLSHNLPEPQSSSDIALANRIQASAAELQEYAKVARKTFQNCYQSYRELSAILDADGNQRQVKKKPSTSSPPG